MKCKVSILIAVGHPCASATKLLLHTDTTEQFFSVGLAVSTNKLSNKYNEVQGEIHHCSPNSDNVVSLRKYLHLTSHLVCSNVKV